MYNSKKNVLLDYPELALSEFGDLIIKENYVKAYELIDFHCHSFEGIKELFPAML